MINKIIACNGYITVRGSTILYNFKDSTVHRNFTMDDFQFGIGGLSNDNFTLILSDVNKFIYDSYGNKVNNGEKIFKLLDYSWFIGMDLEIYNCETHSYNAKKIRTSVREFTKCEIFHSLSDYLYYPDLKKVYKFNIIDDAFYEFLDGIDYITGNYLTDLHFVNKSKKIIQNEHEMKYNIFHGVIKIVAVYDQILVLVNDGFWYSSGNFPSCYHPPDKYSRTIRKLSNLKDFHKVEGLIDVVVSSRVGYIEIYENNTYILKLYEKEYKFVIHGKISNITLTDHIMAYANSRGNVMVTTFEKIDFVKTDLNIGISGIPVTERLYDVEMIWD